MCQGYPKQLKMKGLTAVTAVEIGMGGVRFPKIYVLKAVEEVGI